MPSTQFEIAAEGARLVGWRQGRGPTVLLLHGGPGLSDYLESLVPELADGYDLVRYQQRGVPPSSTEGPFRVEDHVADAIRVLDQLGLSRVLLLGHSWGGHLALHLLASHPERFRAALVVDPLGAVPDGGEADLGRNLSAHLDPRVAARAAELDARAMRGEGTEEDQVEGLGLVWPGYFADPATAPPMPPMRISVDCYSQTFDSIHDHFRRQTLVRRLPGVEVPLTLLLGAKSPIPNRHGEATAALVPGAELRVAEGVGHLLWLERPGLVREALDGLRERSAD